MRQYNRKKRVAPQSPLHRDFYIYVSGAYEKTYIAALHPLLREKYRINLHCSEYTGGGDFQSGIALLKSDLKRKLKQSVTKNLEKSEMIMVQGDMDVAYVTDHLDEFERDLKEVDERCKIIPSIINFEAWLQAHFKSIQKQRKPVRKQDIDQHIPSYSESIAHAEKYFKGSLQWPLIEKAMDEHQGNDSFRKFMLNFQ